MCQSVSRVVASGHVTPDHGSRSRDHPHPRWSAELRLRPTRGTSPYNASGISGCAVCVNVCGSRIRRWGGRLTRGGFLADHLLVAHFVAGPRSQELRCSRAHCAWRSVLRFSISVPCLSQSHRTSPLTSISARRRRRRGPDLQKLSWSTASKGARVCW